MFDDRENDTGVFDFDEFANHLLEQGLETSPADIHGCLCGLLSAGAAVEPELALAALVEAMELELRGELADLVMQLYRVSAAALEDEEFDFHPLLPDDESSIETRVSALAGWCGGFLAGFALVSAGAGSESENTVSKDSAEILKDFAAIAQADAAEDEDDDEDGEGAEEHYFELVEYLRFATLNVYMDSRARAQEAGRPPGGETPLH
jgi:uncharacterized protein